MKNFIANIKWFFRILKENFKTEQNNSFKITFNNDNLKVMTFNIRRDVVKDRNNNWQYRKEAIVEMIANTAPDIICMQEVMPHMAKYLKAQLSNCYDCCGIENFTGKEITKSFCIIGEGLLTFYRKGRFTKDDIIKKIKLYDGRKINLRRAFSINLYDSCTNKWINVINTHFCHKSNDAKKKSFEKLIKYWGENYWDSTFICGDFNCGVHQIETGIDIFTNEFTYNNPDKEGTVNFFSGNSGRTIDFVFSDCPIKDSKVIRESYAGRKFLSDHWPVINTY